MATYCKAPFEVKEINGIDAIRLVSNVNAGEEVSDGYGISTAPTEKGIYSLWQKVNEDNTHAGFVWEKEV